MNITQSTSMLFDLGGGGGGGDIYLSNAYGLQNWSSLISLICTNIKLS